MIILLHSSKTMRSDIIEHPPVSTPSLISNAQELNYYLRTLSAQEIEQCMAVSSKLANKVQEDLLKWSAVPSDRSAIDSFVGDIYSGLQTGNWSADDIAFAQKHLRILSGLYGILRPLDDIRPYRLEMGYKLPAEEYKNLYNFWGKDIVSQIPANSTVINLSAVEYSRTITQYIDPDHITTPAFLTVSPKTGEPTFVTVHAKIARGAFASWIIRNKITSIDQIQEFNELNYRYNSSFSEPNKPVFVCEQFGGLGLSVRLKKPSA